jgi:tetratricopeptide (TPR) repeat protein
MTYSRGLALIALIVSAAAAAVFAALLIASSGDEGSFVVTSQPEGAGLFIDGEFRGMTPVHLPDLAEGSHALRFEKAGYEILTASSPAEVEPGSALKYQLPRVRVGTLEITSEPSSAEVFVDGHYRGATPLVLADIHAGPHLLRLEKSNHSPWTGSVLVQDGEVTHTTSVLEDRVLTFLQQALAENPTDILRHVELGHYYVVTEEPEIAADIYMKGRELARESEVSKEERNRLEKQIRKDMMVPGKVGERFRAAIHPSRQTAKDARLDPKKAMAMAKEEEAKGRLGVAAEIIERALQHQPNDLTLLEEHTRLVLGVGDKDKAIAALGTAFRRFGGDVPARIRIARVCLESRARYDEAGGAAVLTQCANQLAAYRARADGDRPELDEVLWRLYAAAGRANQALPVIKDVIDRQKDATERSRLQLERGRLLVQAGRRNEARDVLAKVAEESPDEGVRTEARTLLAQTEDR